MKLVTYIRDDVQTWGVVHAGRVLDGRTLCPDGPGSVLELLRAGPEALAALAGAAASADGDAGTDLRDVALLAPIPHPPTVLALAGNYVEHCNEGRTSTDMPDNPRGTTTPRAFLMPGTAVIRQRTFSVMCLRVRPTRGIVR